MIESIYKTKVTFYIYLRHTMWLSRNYDRNDYENLKHTQICWGEGLE